MVLALLRAPALAMVRGAARASPRYMATVVSKRSRGGGEERSGGGGEEKSDGWWRRGGAVGAVGGALCLGALVTKTVVAEEEQGVVERLGRRREGLQEYTSEQVTHYLVLGAEQNRKTVNPIGNSLQCQLLPMLLIPLT